MNVTEIWIQFMNKADYDSKEKELSAFFSEDGEKVCTYLAEERAVRRMPQEKRINLKDIEKVKSWIGEGNVKVTTKEKSLEEARSFYRPDNIEVSLERIANALDILIDKGIIVTCAKSCAEGEP